ncbi:MAG: hypothetical protein ACP5U2_16905, partial [Bryobacteraceae bacterium]
PDLLYLSLWTRDFRAENMLDRFGRLLRVFPFSRLRPGISSLRVQAIAESEPPLMEQVFATQPPVEEVIALAREFSHPDCAFIVEGWWELWQWKEEWSLLPSRVTLFCFGPEFENDVGDHLRIELGTQRQFLPDLALPQGERIARSNLRSVVRLAEEITRALPVTHRQLWSESGENFAALVEAALSEEG